MSDNSMIYAVARIRTKEMSLLNGAFMEQLLAADGEEACLRLLSEHGWGPVEMGASAMLKAQEQAIWDLIRELVGEKISQFDVFLYEIDYHNLKAAIKESCTAGVHPGIYSEAGTIPYDFMEQALADRDFKRFPERMQAVAEEALDVLLQTRDGQLCDCIVDRAALMAIKEAGKASKSQLLALYGELNVVTADIKTALRGALMHKDKAFLERAMAPCDSLDVSRLIQAAVEGVDAIPAYLEMTAYAEAIPELKKSPAAFECWCDNLLIRRIRPELHNSFGIDPLAAYILARRSEIKTVRIILTGKRNELSEDVIRGRVRETYV